MPEIFWTEGKAKILYFIPDHYVLLWGEKHVCEGTFNKVCLYYHLEFFGAVAQR